MKIDNIKSMAVFCGSSNGKSPWQRILAIKVGTTLAKHGITVVYGGASCGLMGAVADAALAQGGKVIGVVPEDQPWGEVTHTGLTKLIKVPNLSERKKVMSEHSQSGLALPGGYGTMDELFEYLTWTQLNIQNKLCGLLNDRNFYDGLISQVNHMTNEGFVSREHRKLLIDEKDLDKLLMKLDERCCVKESNLELA